MSNRQKWKPFDDPDVADVFEKYPKGIREKLMRLRQLIFDTAKATDGVGEVVEALRWGEPSYLTVNPKSGTTIRIDSKDSKEFAVYVNCQTDLIARFKALYPDEFEYRGNRSINFAKGDRLPEGPLSHCISLALTYHRDKR